ncbi:cytochrome P450 [Amycolatopsis palatopharyngis]|uniref:cytochrome P450 n=1 Tax=Amycolatopsis palatopharyngis TaxID=187982 RepID=UPI000E2587DD|nr:cytochrome P450 [Amycolatopsis palatopharyngis]
MSRTAQELVFPRPLTPEGAPDPLLLEMARTSPVLRVIGPGDSPAWLVAGEAEVRIALSEPDRFTSVPPANLDDQRAYAVPLVGMDPPEHTRLRKLATKAFSPRRIASMQPTIDSLVASLLDDLVAAGPPADIVSALAYPLPLEVVFGMLGGIPEEVRADLRRWTDIFTSLDSSSFEDIGSAVAEFHACMRELILRRRSELGDDLMSDLIRARDERGALSEEELIGTMGLLIVAGYETTAKVISRAVMTLLVSGTWRELAAGTLPVGDAVEEVLRHQSPNTAICRTAKVDTELGGARITAGDAVYISTHLGNFDPTTRADPGTFDPARTDTGHTTFGYGLHFCLGAALARAELSTVFTALPARLPGLRLATGLAELEWNVGSWLNAPNSVPVTW